ncbi:MAG: ATP synthase F1 subunit epsilon [Deltaproteobacteria bacterium]|nr:ATP synthase F1 subunit epsilon [Deltaproteobacteria bacterium]
MDEKKKIKLNLITQDKTLVSEDVSFVVLPSEAGPLGILPGHAPLLGTLDIGELLVRDISGKEFKAFVGRGFFMISREGVSMVAHRAELEDQIDVDRATTSRERARKILLSTNTGMDIERARDAMRRADVRIRIVKGAAA